MNVYSLQSQWGDDIVTRAKLIAIKPKHCCYCGMPLKFYVVQKLNPKWMVEQCQECGAEICFTRVVVLDVLAEVVKIK